MNFNTYYFLFHSFLLFFRPSFLSFLFVIIISLLLILYFFFFFYFRLPLHSRLDPGRRVLYTYNIIRVSVYCCSLHSDTARWQLYDNYDNDDDEQAPQVPAHQKNTWQFNDSDSPTLYSIYIYYIRTTTPSLLWLLYYYRCHVYLTTMTLTIF